MSRRLAVLTLLALLVAPIAQAASTGPVFGLRAAGNPKLGYFVYSIAPGGVKRGAIIVSNTGNRAGTVKLYSADATTGRTTGTVYLTDKAAANIGSWVRLSRTSLTLLPGRHATVPFVVHVPRGAKPGQWVSGIVAETAQAATGPKAKRKANVQIRIRNLTIVAVQANVPGPPIVSFTIGTVTTGGQKGFQEVIVHFANRGNVLLKPKGTVAIFDSSSKLVERLTFVMDTFLPKTAIDYPVLLKKALAPGDYRAQIQLLVPGAAGGSGKTFNSSRSFSVSKQDVTQVFTSTTPTQAPPVGTTSSGTSSTTHRLLIGGAAAAALLALALALFWLVGRRRKGRANPRSRSAGPSDGPSPTEPKATSWLDQAEVLFPPSLTAPPESTPPLAVPPAPVAPAALRASCDHLWEVAYERGQLGGDGVWRFPHRCRTCGLELFAADIDDASAQALRTASG